MTDSGESRFGEPSDLGGVWSDRQVLSFWDTREPLTVRRAIEKMTTTLLQRAIDDEVGVSFHGTAGGVEDRRVVRLTLRAVSGERVLYDLVVEQTKPRRWMTQAAFEAECRVAFAHRASQLTLATTEMPWSNASADALQAVTRETIEQDRAAAAWTEDPAPVEALKREVIDALRRGCRIRDAHKEGGTVFSFDGTCFVRADYGDGPDRSARWTDERSMLEALARYFEWETHSDTWPHPPLQRDVWLDLRNRLRAPP